MHLLARWFTHLSAFSVRGLIEKHFFPTLTSHLLPPTLFTSTSLLCSSPITDCPRLFQSLSLFPGNSQWVGRINFLSSLFFCVSILSFIVFPLSSHTVVSHLPRPSCRASGQGADSQSERSKPMLCFFCFFSSFVFFVFHLHPALALLNLYHVALPPLSRVILSFLCLVSLPDNFTSPLLFSKQPLRLLLCGSRRRQPVEGEEEWKNEGHEQYSVIREPKPNVMPLCSHGVR